MNHRPLAVPLPALVVLAAACSRADTHPLVATPSAQHVLHAAPTELLAPTGEYDFGWSVAACDLDQDGYVDLVVADEERYSGQVHLFRGSAAGLPSAPDFTIPAPSGANGFGWRVRCVGDLNGDGYPDLAVGAAEEEEITGAVYLYPGSAAGPSTTASERLGGIQAGGQYGSVLAGGRDVNGDGYDDLVVAAPYEPAAWVYAGRPEGVHLMAHLTNPDAGFGVSAALADLDGDGFADVLLGDPAAGGGRGAVDVYQGGADGVQDSVWSTISGSGASDAFGGAIAPVPDGDADGDEEIAVGAPAAYDYHGSVSLLMGGPDPASTPAAWFAQGGYDELMGTVVDVGDFNGDGYTDVVTSSWQTYTTGRGKVWLYLGTKEGLAEAPAWTVAGEDDYLAVGYDLAVADFDGDGADDLVVGKPPWAGPAGSVDIYYGLRADVDLDGDGFPAGSDCDDEDGTVSPGGTDIPGDGIDQDCSGADALLPDDTGADTGAGDSAADTSGDTSGDTAGPTGGADDSAGAPKPSGCGCATHPSPDPEGALGALILASAIRRRAGRG